MQGKFPPPSQSLIFLEAVIPKHEHMARSLKWYRDVIENPIQSAFAFMALPMEYCLEALPNENLCVATSIRDTLRNSELQKI